MFAIQYIDMNIDIRGKINEKKLAYNNTLLPLYEAIANSIHSIEDDSATKPGLIEVDIIRSNEPELNLPGMKKPQIIDFNITDNGIGFNDENFESFNLAHSTYKFHKGGKGLGRFIWLRAFHFAEIESIYKENDHFVIRKFNFEPTKDGIEKHTRENIGTIEKRYTTVKLRILKKDYWQWCNSIAEDIAFKIIEHCFIYFLKPDCPRIILKDSDEIIVVNDLFNQFKSGGVSKTTINLDNYEFEINLVRLYNTKRIDNKIHFVAHTREVENKDISKLIPELDANMSDLEGQKFSIGVYVTSTYFDERVNDDRTKIQFVDNKNLNPLFKELEENELLENILDVIKGELSDNIILIEKEREERISNFIENHPQYNKLKKYKPDRIKKLSSKLSDEELDIELFKIKQEIDLDVRFEADTIFKQIENIADKEEIENFKQLHSSLYEKIIDVGNSKLSEYVFYRKFILDFLDKHIGQTKEGKFAKEEIIHKIIFPLKTESDEIGHDEHNLWIIDERLAFHKYLASDRSFKQNKNTTSKSNDRPDLIIFNKPFAFTDSDKPYSSIVIVEFKRPMRDDYDEDENPILQVNKYTRELINNKLKDKHGRQFDLRPNTPIYAFIVCDLTPNLRTSATDNSFIISPDNDGYFKFNQNYSLYLEIISFDKLIRDSKQRNKVFFEKLNLQTV